jgi:hypothetical protein
MTTPIIVKRDRTIQKPIEVLWTLVEPAEGIFKWPPMAESSELISGQGKGRVQMMFSKWGNKEARIEQEVVEYEPLRLIRWKNTNELLNGRKAPLISKQTYFTVKLLPDGNGTNVTLQSENYPANFIKGLLIRLIAKPRIDMAIKKSLEILSA